jgi:hypothetical protein
MAEEGKGKTTASYKFHAVTAICGVTFLKNTVHCET